MRGKQEIAALALLLGLLSCAAATIPGWASAQQQTFEARIEQAHQVLDGGRAESALLLFEELSRERPRSPQARFGKAAALLAAGRSEAARRLFVELEQLNPGDLGVQAYLARLAFIEADEEAARRRLETIRGEAPYSDLLHLQLLEWAVQSDLSAVAAEQARFVLNLPLTSVHRARACYLEGLLALGRGRRADGLAALEAAVAAAPRELAYWTAWLTAQGSADIAQLDAKELSRALTLFPDSPELLALSALREIRLERLDEARRVQAKLRALDPIQADLVLGRLELESLRFAEAEQAFDRVVNANPDDARARRDRGVARARQGRPDAALEDLRAALETVPDDAEALFETARLLADLGRHAEAEEPLERLLEKAEDNARAVYLMYRVQQALGDAEDAGLWRERFRAIAQ